MEWRKMGFGLLGGCVDVRIGLGTDMDMSVRI